MGVRHLFVHGRNRRIVLRFVSGWDVEQRQRSPVVLYAVAAAVIGGTSLFGGRGKVMHGVMGGLVIGGNLQRHVPMVATL